MKKLLSLILTVSILLLALVSCGGNDDNAQIRIGYMSGPTGMGMAKLIHDNKDNAEKYSFKQYENTKLAFADLTAGKIDVICAPTNESANYFNTVDDSTVILAINTLNTLFLVSDAETTINSFAELEGKTVYTCKNGTPKVVLEYLLEEAKVNATVSTSVNGTEITTPQQLAQQIIAGNISIAVAPEPIVTSATMQNNSYSIDLNMNTVWESVASTELTMGCIIANGNFVTQHKGAINAFLLEYEASINFMRNAANLDTAANYIVESGIMAAIPAAKSALRNLGGSIAYIDGSEMKTSLKAFLAIVGVSSPAEKFYYAK